MCALQAEALRDGLFATADGGQVIKAHGTGMTTDMNMEDMEDMEDTHGGHSWRTLMEDHMLS